MKYEYTKEINTNTDFSAVGTVEKIEEKEIENKTTGGKFRMYYVYLICKQENKNINLLTKFRNQPDFHKGDCVKIEGYIDQSQYISKYSGENKFNNTLIGIKYEIINNGE